MNVFSKLYDQAILWAKHRYASYWLALVSFTESSFFLVPPDVLLAPMCVAKPHQAWRYAWITTVASVLGGLLGYLIGFYFFQAMEPYLLQWGYGEKLALLQVWFDEYGVLAVLIAGFSPIPYKLFTLSAGAMSLALGPFVLASLVGRGARFFIVAALMKTLGPVAETKLKPYMDRLGWGLVLLVGVYLLW